MAGVAAVVPGHRPLHPGVESPAGTAA
jgi:hypothetical protein